MNRLLMEIGDQGQIETCRAWKGNVPGGLAGPEERRERRQNRGTAVIQRPAVAVVGEKERIKQARDDHVAADFRPSSSGATTESQERESSNAKERIETKIEIEDPPRRQEALLSSRRTAKSSAGTPASAT